MASYTSNLNLKKPADGESYNVSDQNGNMDKIDAALTVGKVISTSVAVNTPYTLEIDDGRTYLISMMTSSDQSTRIISISRRGSYCRLLELAAGTYQTYYTETLQNNVWRFTCSYVTQLNILRF